MKLLQARLRTNPKCAVLRTASMVNDGLVANPDGASRPANEPAGYRVRSGFKPDYPIVSPNYSESRRAMAVKVGLGRESGQTKLTKA